MDIGALLTRHTRYRPNHLAFVFGDERLTWRDMNARVGAKFQRVGSVTLLESFPRNVAGKTLKREIRKRYLEES